MTARRLFAPAFQSTVFSVCLLLAACGPREVEPPPAKGTAFKPTSFQELPGWSEDAVAQALPPLRRSCARLALQPGDRPVGPDGMAGTVDDWRRACVAVQALASPSDSEVRGFLERHFKVYAVTSDGDPTGKITGYYEAELTGTRSPVGDEAVPIYAPPEDLVTADLGRFCADLEGRSIVGQVDDGRLVPYHTRAEIENGALEGKARPLLYADSPVDLFVLHVQGSGRVRLPDGTVVRLGYAASNGHPFTAIGRALVERGAMTRENASMQAVRSWLRTHTEKGRALMQENARYIFFRVLDGDGPIGAQGVALTPERSLAVDPAHLPLGAPVWLDTTAPGASEAPLRRLTIAQDSGSAIKGAVRADYFWGFGEEALEHAGGMNEEGRLYLFLPRTVVPRTRATS